MSKSERTGKVSSRIKTKKKAWYPIISSKIFAQREIGESYLEAPEKAIGRIVHSNLKDLTGNIKEQNVYVKFRITNVERNVLHATALGYELTVSSVKRMVRKNADRLDIYCRFSTKDNHDVVLKGLILTKNKTYRSVRAMLRRDFSSFMKKEAAVSTFDVFLSNIASNRLQTTIKKMLTKIVPLKEVAVRVVETRGILPAMKGEGSPVESSTIQAENREEGAATLTDTPKTENVE